MSTENIKRMKILIEEKKKQNSKRVNTNTKPTANIKNSSGGSKKAYKNTKTGGCFDK
ncbi:hypothetical protein [Alkalibaculum sporogenes]|uniref:hypothetical protein n=1 Tax=Alkalibaculum sporogenes TaxID=2655001 RepID=UPI00187B2988|nr:hypothetical protein [Alkalibaculum sporogenes]